MRDRRELQPVAKVNRVALPLLKGIDRSRDTLIENTTRFAAGLPANNALLWGARGMGKSSLVKAVHAAVAAALPAGAPPLKLIEIHREDIETPAGADAARPRPRPSASSSSATTSPSTPATPPTNR